MSRQAASASITPSRGQLLDVTTDVAWRLKAYDAYGGNQATAIRAIRRQCPGFTAQQYSNALQKALALYEAVEELVQQRQSQLWAAHNAGDDSWPKHLDSELHARFAGFRRSTFHSLVGMMFYYWHMR